MTEEGRRKGVGSYQHPRLEGECSWCGFLFLPLVLGLPGVIFVCLLTMSASLFFLFHSTIYPSINICGIFTSPGCLGFGSIDPKTILIHLMCYFSETAQ